MRKEFLSWFERHGLLLTAATSSIDDPEDEIKIIVKAPMVALSQAPQDFRECPDPVLFGYPESCLDVMLLEDLHEFVLEWFEKAVEAGMARCFVCNAPLTMGREKPWDAVFVASDLYLWLLLHFDCKRALSRQLKGRSPFEIAASPPEHFDIYVEGTA